MSKVQPIEELVELSTAEQRRDYLDRVCGEDAELRQRLEELVRSHEEAEHTDLQSRRDSDRRLVTSRQ